MPQSIDAEYEKRLTTKLEACSRGLARLTQCQTALRYARLRARLGVPADLVEAELRLALARRGQAA